MPDLSSAPADIQAIWKKVMSGGAPTEAEAKRLSDWLAANKDQIVKKAMAGADSMRRAGAGRGLSAGAGGTLPQCPNKTTLPASLAFDPNDAAAAALLDSLRRTYAARLSGKTAQSVQTMIAGIRDAAQLNLVGGLLFLKGYAAPAVLAFVAEAEHASADKRQSAWGDLGAVLLGVGDPLHAVRVMRRTLLLGPRTAGYVTDLGIAYADLGDLGTATTLLTQATNLSPHWAQAWDAIARVQSCAGNMIAAAHAMQKAQDDDFDAGRQDHLDNADNDPNNPQAGGGDDATEAAKPLPQPPGRSPFPPPPGGGGNTAYFEGWAPKLGSTWKEQASYLQADLTTAQAFRSIRTQILAERDTPHVSSGPPSAPSGMTLIFSISNGAQARRGAGLVQDRIKAKAHLMIRANVGMIETLNKEVLSRLEPISAKYGACRKANTNDLSVCEPPFCSAKAQLAAEDYAKRRGSTATLIGGLAGLSAQLTTHLNQWFDWAGDPDDRAEIDRIRRSELVNLEADAYQAAAGTQTVIGGCDKPPAAETSSKPKGDSKRDAGECKSRSIHLPHFAKMDADCHEMKMTVDYFDEFGTPTLDLQRASSTKNGKFFLGASGDMAGGMLGGAVGVQVTWDQGGWVQTAGVAATGEAGMDGVAHVSGDMSMNGLQTGPAASGTASASVPAFGFAPAVSFGGKG